MTELARSATALPARTVGLLSPCGWGNLGDAAIQDSVIAAVRERWPNARILAFTLNPADTERRHHIEAFPLSGHVRLTYPIAGRKLWPTARLVEGGLRWLQHRRLLWRTVPFFRSLCDFLQSEPLHCGLAFGLLRKMDVLIVSGGGQLDDFWGGAWGHPYALWKWSVLAWAARTPMMMLSVGFGTLRSPLARSFTRGALRRVVYRSFRDDHTLSHVARLLRHGRPGPVVPDLAFGLATNVPPRTGTRPPVVGVSPIAYFDPRAWALKDGAVYRRYVDRLADFVKRLTDAGRQVVLFTSDTSDQAVMHDVFSSAGRPKLATCVLTDTVAALFAVLATVDVAVASRLHGVILAQIAERPVVAVSYDWKVSQHMNDVGQGEFCLDIETFDAAALCTAVLELERDAASVRMTVRELLAEYRRRVVRQFAEVLR